MFVLQPSVIETGIEVYKSRKYVWETGMLRGSARVFDGTPDVHLCAGAHLDRLKAIDAVGESVPQDSLLSKFNPSRALSLFIGAYPSFDIATGYLEQMDQYFRQVLRRRGAANRVLRPVEGGEALVATDSPTENDFGEALKYARDLEVYTMLLKGEAVSIDQLVGRVFRSLATALGVEYSIQEEREVANPRHLKSVMFGYDKLAIFKFEAVKDAPVRVTRYTYAMSGNYCESFQGDATYDVMRTKVCGWLIDALQERRVSSFESEQDYHDFQANLRGARTLFAASGDPVGAANAFRPKGALLHLVP